MIDRRGFLAGLGAVTLVANEADIVKAHESGIRAAELGLRPGAADDQGRALQSILEKASLENKPVFLEPGTYRISNVTLPNNTRLFGVPGATILSYAGGDHFLYAENATDIRFEGLVIDGRLRPVKEYADACLRISGSNRVTVRDCHFTNAAGYGLYVERAAGDVSDNRIDNALGYAGIIGLANTGLAVMNNTVEDCANAGIIIHRWERAEDNTIISGNRIRRISSIKGGTGQYGNGINTYQCNGVIIRNNHISDCALSAIRSNSCSNIQIGANTCLRSGETAIYSEFAFQGANVTGNIVDGAARGISIANMDHGGRLSICANNLVRNLHENIPYPLEGHIFGTGILAEADIAVTGNVIENAPRFGVLLGWGPYLRDVVASNNIIREARAGFYVSVVEGIGKVAITDNLISGTVEGAVMGYRWTEPATDDLALVGTSAFPSLQVSRNKLDS